MRKIIFYAYNYKYKAPQHYDSRETIRYNAYNAVFVQRTNYDNTYEL